MKVEILSKSQEAIWDKFVFDHPLGTMSQTSKWGEFQAKIPTRGRYWIVVLKNRKKIFGGTIVIRHGLAKGKSWLYAGRGPLLDYKSKHFKKNIQLLLKEIKKIAQKENSIFFRMDPPLEKSSYKKWPKLNWFFTSHLGFQPEDTLILDITKSEKEILEQMKPKGRYNIRLAEKKGVTIRKSDPKNKEQFEKDLDTFHKILHETAMRDKFYGHRKSVYKAMLETLSEKASLYLAEHQGKIIAGLIATFYKDTATYYYGASSDSFRNVMAPYLLQWTVIKEAKQKDFKVYDFLGISPENVRNHPWAGVTDFKKKFGGAHISYLPSKEYPFKKLLYIGYRLYKFLRK
ncbi:MAG: peptidoglycan bridge formation glycyltransferase FemA/FemB family protein [Candidatus Gracilibacteria bacterium]|nr:peptidoglycan bridge formation glycyltransferase FemA/FemB family protein [Candidatus Gracilibacteria bacterium]